MRRLAWGAAIVAGSFLATLWVLNTFFPRQIADTAPFPRLAVGQTVEFKNGQNRPALVSGWSVPEAWGVWSDGPEAGFGLRIINGNAKSDLKLAFEGRTAIFPQSPQQRIQLWVGNVELGEVTLTNRNASFSVPLNRVGLDRDEYPLLLTFKFPTAVKLETRRLAFGLKTVRLES
jgi:hypothetical protein